MREPHPQPGIQEGPSSAAAAASPAGRDAAVLSATLETYWATGQPVGSKALTVPGGPSAATIRHVLADLESAGYLFQPHTSAGRIPTAQAIRWWLKQIRRPLPLLSEDAGELERQLREAADDEPTLWLRASEFLSQSCHQLGLVAVEPWQDAGLRSLRFFHLSDRRVLAILVTNDGRVRERVGRVPEPYSQPELDTAANFFNRQFSGLTLVQIRAELLRRLDDDRAAYDELLKRALVLSHCNVLRMEDSGAVYFHGAAHLAEVLDAQQLSFILDSLQQKERWLHLLGGIDAAGEDLVEWDWNSGEGVRVWVSLDRESMPEFSLVATRYRHGDVGGALGILGTNRMEYRRALATVALVRDTVSRILKGNSA